MYWFLKVVKNYVGFDGRAQRKEFWMFTLFHFIIYIVLGIIDIVIGTYSYMSNIGLFTGLFVLAMLLPALAVSVRRLHDIGKSAAYYFICFIPIVGFIVMIVFWARDSQPGEGQINRAQTLERGGHPGMDR